MTSQLQKTGDNSTNIQAETITIREGISYSEARQIALDVFRVNFIELAGAARESARKRAEEITESFLQKLQSQHPSGLGQAGEPDFQHALFTVQKEYARCGDKELGDLLVDLLVDRTKHPSRTIIQIVLNESLAVAPKLTSDQLATLSVIFMLRYAAFGGIGDQQMLWERLDRFVSPFVPQLTSRAPCYQHLEYSGCGAMSVAAFSLSEMLRRNYGGIFSKGFDASQLTAKQLSISESHAIFTQCLNDRNRLQVNAISEEVIKSEAKRLEIPSDDIPKILALHNEWTMNSQEIIDVVIKAREYMKVIFDTWTSTMGHFTLTSVGIAIGHANVKKQTGEFTNLSIWIN